jgi:hypothetical protein
LKKKWTILWKKMKDYLKNKIKYVF